MGLRPPPYAARSLADLPSRRLADRVLRRVWRADLPDGTVRSSPWWFASRPADPSLGGRYDLPDPMGTCYLATSPVAAALEALQAQLTNLPAGELRVRRLATVRAPDDAPDAADLVAPVTAGRGVTAALWAGPDRHLTQRWAAALRRDGWWALHSGVQHDPAGLLRSVALFDHAGQHPPTHGGTWRVRTARLDRSLDLAGDLARFGVHVREPGVLPEAAPPLTPPRARAGPAGGRT